MDLTGYGNLIIGIANTANYHKEIQKKKANETYFSGSNEYFWCLSSVYAAGLITEIGQIERFENQAKLAKYAGLHWKKSESGNNKSENTPLTKREIGIFAIT